MYGEDSVEEEQIKEAERKRLNRIAIFRFLEVCGFSVALIALMFGQKLLEKRVTLLEKAQPAAGSALKPEKPK